MNIYSQTIVKFIVILVFWLVVLNRNLNHVALQC